MKRNLGFMVLITLLLIACGEIAYSAQDSYGCFRDKERELCVTLRAGKDVVQIGEVLPLTITVTSSQDEQGLILLLSTVVYSEFMKSIQFPGQEITYEDNFNKGWEFDIKANQPIIFNGNTSFGGEYGSFSIQVSISDPYLGQLVSNSLEVVFFDEKGGLVLYAGTKAPITEGPAPVTVYFYTDTPGPFPTWAPSATWYPEIATREALTQQAARTPEPQTEEPSP